MYRLGIILLMFCGSVGRGSTGQSWDSLKAKVTFGESVTRFEVRNTKKGHELRLSGNQRSSQKKTLAPEDFLYLLAQTDSTILETPSASGCGRKVVELVFKTGPKETKVTRCLVGTTAADKATAHLLNLLVLAIQKT